MPSLNRNGNFFVILAELLSRTVPHRLLHPGTSHNKKYFLTSHESLFAVAVFIRTHAALIKSSQTNILLIVLPVIHYFIKFFLYLDF